VQQPCLGSLDIETIVCLTATKFDMVGKNILSEFIPSQVCLRDKLVGWFNGRFASIKVVCEQQLGYGQNVFPNHSQTSTLRTRAEMVFEKLGFSPLNHLTRLIARENFIILSRRESNRSRPSICL
jgi:hypothetical protein